MHKNNDNNIIIISTLEGRCWRWRLKNNFFSLLNRLLFYFSSHVSIVCESVHMWSAAVYFIFVCGSSHIYIQLYKHIQHVCVYTDNWHHNANEKKKKTGRKRVRSRRKWKDVRRNSLTRMRIFFYYFASFNWEGRKECVQRVKSIDTFDFLLFSHTIPYNKFMF